MCTAVTLRTKDFYFGRTLDYGFSYAEEVTITPRKFTLPFRHREPLSSHHAIIGMAHVVEDYPLYYDAMNEKGLAMAGLNFVGYAHYEKPVPGKENIAQFELLPWILGQCASVREAVTLMEQTNITDTPFNEQLPSAQLHWILADHQEAVTIESTKDGIQIYDNPMGVLTNNPPFPQQLFQLNNFMHLTARPPENRFSDQIQLSPYSRGMGALGLPGDYSSQSRFVRAAFVKLNSVCGHTEAESVSQFFHILGCVDQPRGCCELENGEYEHTIYTSCCNTDKGIYYYTTYENHQITAVNLHREKLDDVFLIRFPLALSQSMHTQN